MPELLLIDWILMAAMGWLLIGLVGVAFPHSFTLIRRGLFPLGAGCGLALAYLAMTGIDHGIEVLTLPIGLPDLPFHLRIDALSSFFLFLLILEY